MLVSSPRFLCHGVIAVCTSACEFARHRVGRRIATHYNGRDAYLLLSEPPNNGRQCVVTVALSRSTETFLVVIIAWETAWETIFSVTMIQLGLDH